MSTPVSLDERDLFLEFLGGKREDVLAAAEGLDEDGARWRPNGKLIAVIGILNHLTAVEWRWIDGRYLREQVSRTEEEFHVGPERTLAEVVESYRARAAKTDGIVRSSAGLDAPCLGGPGQPERPGLTLRWVLLHLIEETAHHAGHADATRELLDGTTR